MPWTKDNRPSHRTPYRDVKDMPHEQIDVCLGEWYFREDKHGDVRGYTEDGRRTPLKGQTKTHTALQKAQNDALNGRWVCSDWPNCQHYVGGQPSDSIEACVAAARQQRNRPTAIGLKGDQMRRFRGRKEYQGA